MADASTRTGEPQELTEFAIGIARGAAGALLFGIPMLMTMELWQLGFYIERDRLFVLLLLNIPLLIMLARMIGFEQTSRWPEAYRDAMIAYALGVFMSAAILVMLGDIKLEMPLSEILGKIAIQAVPASIGALLGRSQLGDKEDTGDDADENNGLDDSDPVEGQLSTRYSRELFLMAVGALFLNLNVAPTEEVILISYKMTPWHALVVILVSIAIMHGFVYAVSFRGTHEIPDDTPRWHVFFRFTLPGYVIALIVSLYVLWVFGRLDHTVPAQMLMSTIVLSFPGAIGAAAARLIL
ncbi:TIGR02587 family membrane protein [Agrobacterium tumefaciens]|uniref:TIGR02587 family membrane protein n=1 Tax=Agrobacterium tumefaciens TaxID=358 RepID=UPI00287C5EE3|nr:TIGR02587 family membrane protein [Agrobacterium tumefaciens]MDS7594641.1 TIGR02587 family membrane protein [Agrobacterium tumefaciens]